MTLDEYVLELRGYNTDSLHLRSKIKPKLSGITVEVLFNPNSHDYGIPGTRFVIADEFQISYRDSSRNRVNLSMARFTTKDAFGAGNNIYGQSLKVISLKEVTKIDIINKITALTNQKKQIKTELKEKISKLKELRKEARKKLGFLQETKSDIFNEEEFKRFINQN